MESVFREKETESGGLIVEEIYLNSKTFIFQNTEYKSRLFVCLLSGSFLPAFPVTEI
jgi:hypothetical protein